MRQLKRQGTDIQSKIEELEQLYQTMSDQDKMKDDAIVLLSDKFVSLVYYKIMIKR